MASILLDQNIPRGLRHELAAHNARTAYFMGWADLVNGALITAAERAGFDVLITADRNLRYQQNLHGRRLALVVLSSNNWPTIRRSLEAIRRAVGRAEPGTFQDVGLDHPSP